MNDDFENDEEITRRTAHLILDLLAAVDVDSDEDHLPAGWANTIAAEMAEVGAISVTVNDAGVRALSITPLMSAVTQLLEVLIDSTAERIGADRLAVISSVRTTVDGWS